MIKCSLVMCGNPFIVVACVLGVFDHQTRVVCNLETLYTSHQLSPTKQTKHDTLILHHTTHVFPENIGPSISCWRKSNLIGFLSGFSRQFTCRCPLLTPRAKHEPALVTQAIVPDSVNCFSSFPAKIARANVLDQSRFSSLVTMATTVYLHYS